jgi:ketosteroid isomerase-like protein
MVAAAEYILSFEQGFLAIGTDANEWFGAREDLIRAYSETAKLGQPKINVQRIEAYQEGPVGWAVDTVMLSRLGKSEIPMRHTFIFHQEGGEWKVIHAHYSFPMPDEGIAPTGA